LDVATRTGDDCVDRFARPVKVTRNDE
jgi:hypothetical protein